MKLTESQMVDLWLRHKYHEPLRTDCLVVRSNADDLRAIARRECRLWYYNLLRNGDPDMLVAHDLSKEFSMVHSMGRDGSIIIALPGECVRPLAVKYSSWLAQAQLCLPADPLARLQANRFSAGGTVAPVAIWLPNNTLQLYGCTYEEGEHLEYLYGAVLLTDDDADEPDAWLYEFRPAALSTIIDGQ